MMYQYSDAELYEISQRQKAQSTILWICGYLEGVAYDESSFGEVKDKIIEKLIKAFPYIAEYINQPEENDDE